jgi:hypothetical protein
VQKLKFSKNKFAKISKKNCSPETGERMLKSQKRFWKFCWEGVKKT